MPPTYIPQSKAILLDCSPVPVTSRRRVGQDRRHHVVPYHRSAGLDRGIKKVQETNSTPNTQQGSSPHAQSTGRGRERATGGNTRPRPNIRTRREAGSTQGFRRRTSAPEPPCIISINQSINPSNNQTTNPSDLVRKRGRNNAPGKKTDTV